MKIYVTTSTFRLEFIGFLYVYADPGGLGCTCIQQHKKELQGFEVGL